MFDKSLNDQSFRHLVFTNFGIGIKDEIWLSYRLEIFLNTVFPSLSNQTIRDFEWIIFIDRALPVIHVNRLEDAIHSSGLNVKLIRVDDYSLVSAEIAQILAGVDAEVLLTSRIDDDDCIHRRAIELIQNASRTESAPQELLVISLENGIEFLPSDQCYREVSHDTLALALTLVDKTGSATRKSITQYSHQVVIDTLQKQGVRAKHIPIKFNEPLYLYTKHPLSDSYFFGARARILGDPNKVVGLESAFFGQYGLSRDRLEYLVQFLKHAPLGMPHKYLEKLGIIRNQIRAEVSNGARISDADLNVLLARKNRYERHAVRTNPARSKEKIRIAILGSCVSRDLFEFQSEYLSNFELCFYMARSSVISFMGLPCGDRRMVIPGDGFEDRRARWDLSKEHWELLEQSRPDIILIDFIDERIGLIQHQGSIFSASGPIIKAFERNDIPFNILRPWNEEIKSLRQWALPKFLDRVHSICQNIIVHKAVWATHFKVENNENQSFAGTEFEKLVELNNEVLNGMLAQLDNMYTPVEQIGGLEAGLLAGGEHLWSFCPYHYDHAYYKTLARQLLARVML